MYLETRRQELERQGTLAVRSLAVALVATILMVTRTSFNVKVIGLTFVTCTVVMFVGKFVIQRLQEVRFRRLMQNK